MSIQLKATEQYFPAVLFIMLYKVVLRVSIQLKATEQYFPVALFIMLYKVVLILKSVDKILKCNHSNESH